MCVQNSSMPIGRTLIKSVAQNVTMESDMLESEAVLCLFGDVARMGAVLPMKAAAGHDVRQGAWTALPMWLRQAVLAVVVQCEQGPQQNDTESSTMPSVASSTSLDNMTATSSQYLIQCDFECIEVPEITLEEYASVLFTSFTSMMTWVRAFALLSRFCKTSGVPLSIFTAHRLLLTALYVTAKYQGVGVDADPSWGIRSDDLLSMEESFVEGIGGDFTVSVAACLCELLPFEKCPREAVVAVGLLVAECVPRQGFSVRMQNWAGKVVCPQACALEASLLLPEFDQIEECESVECDDIFEHPRPSEVEQSSTQKATAADQSKASLRSLGLSQRISQTVSKAKIQSSTLVRKLFRKSRSVEMVA